MPRDMLPRKDAADADAAPRVYALRCFAPYARAAAMMLDAMLTLVDAARYAMLPYALNIRAA